LPVGVALGSIMYTVPPRHTFRELSEHCAQMRYGAAW
jgi:hypothetical protein